MWRIVSASVPSPEIAVATAADRDRTLDSLVAAFRNDPVLRYLFPDDELYAVGAPAFFGRLFDKRVHRNTIWTINHGVATALWEPPADETGSRRKNEGAEGPHVDEIGALLPEDALQRVDAYDDAVHALLPTMPFWYLGVLGTHPDSVGRGWGRAVMRAGLRRAAEDGLPAVLETSSPTNVEFYRRGGWEVVDEVADPLPIWVLRHQS
ncbi:GNAT family N-acetyltransferase [Cryptosporangium sp. NPDC048952]|uniref:GNAT family N-acetyltransferase n=1 Tax=Cryptosporangium sp. NPDC048952 TaxID=3363961 RepID=UPI00371D9CD5